MPRLIHSSLTITDPFTTVTTMAVKHTDRGMVMTNPILGSLILHTPYGNKSHSQHRTPLLANPQSQRDASIVTCFRCNKVGHYAKNCPNSNTHSQHYSSNHSQPQMPSQLQPHTVNQYPQSQQQVQPARNSQPARPIRKINHSSPTTNVTDTDILNTHKEKSMAFSQTLSLTLVPESH